MNVLWLVNVVIPEAGKELGITNSVYGGWISGALNAIRSRVEQITIATTSSAISDTRECSVENVRFIVFPNSSREELEKEFSEFLSCNSFDIIHIYGTEMEHSRAMIEVAPIERIVINIQGLTWYCWQHYLEGTPEKNKNDNIKKKVLRYLTRNRLELPAELGCEHMRIQGQREIETIAKCRNMIGRTSWDKACVMQINHNLKYFHVNEVLRDSFYTDVVWNPNTCDRHSIFLSQAGYPVKGLHYFVKALAIVKEYYPNVHVYIGGGCDIAKHNGIRFIRDKYLGGYFGGINAFIAENNLFDCFTLCGIMDEKEMVNRYLKANVFVCPSVIENSPNSVGEAMMLGTPVVASYVGGIPDMIDNNKEGLLYQTSAPYMLADCIMRIFKDDDFALRLSKNAIARSHITHDKTMNTNALLEVYNIIFEQNKGK